MNATSSNLEITTVKVNSGRHKEVKLHYRPGTLDTVAFEEVLRRNTYRLPERFECGDVVVDIGAHIGSFMVACALRGAARIECYEPDSDNFAILQENAKLLPHDYNLNTHVTLHNMAVYHDDCPQGVSLYRGMDPCMNVVFDNPQTDSPEPCENVPSISLGDIVAEWGTVRLVKIDAEGSEYEILSACTRDDLLCIEELAIETHERAGITSTGLPCNHESLVEYLEWNGFEIMQNTVPSRDNGATNGMICCRQRKAPGLEPCAVSQPLRNKPHTSAAVATTTQLKRLMIVRFPYGNQEAPAVGSWLVRTTLDAKKHPLLDPEILHLELDDTPITMTRNKAVKLAQANQVDYLLMIDSDMVPDMNPGAPAFFVPALDFLAKQEKPSIIAAPYGGPPPCCNVYVFKWANWMNDSANPDMRLEQFTREEVAQRAGIEEVAALPTGLILIDMRVFEKLKPPYFYYEWTDATESEKASTEDVTFTRDASLAGCPVFCNWDAWAGHWKRYLVPKPVALNVETVRKKFADALQSDARPGEKRIDIGTNRPRSTGDGFASLN